MVETGPVDPRRQSGLWEWDIAMNGSELITKYNIICALISYQPRKEAWEIHAFYNGYKMDGLKPEIYRVDADLAESDFTGKSIDDIAQYLQQYVDIVDDKYKE